jgi:hypothetical protein
MRELASLGLLVGRCLDYGCGRGYDAKHYGMEMFDPYYASIMPAGQFDTITCNYVFNVIESNDEIMAVIETIKSKLTDNGIAYIAVRGDVAKDGPTSRGYQRNIKLNTNLIKVGTTRIYKITKTMPVYIVQ